MTADDLLNQPWPADRERVEVPTRLYVFTKAERAQACANASRSMSLRHTHVHDDTRSNAAAWDLHTAHLKPVAKNVTSIQSRKAGSNR